MSDILEIAKEKGIEEGIEKGRAEATREMILDLLVEKFDVLPARISDRIRAIENLDTLKTLHRLVSKCSDINEFISKLCEYLNETETKYPGTEMVLNFKLVSD